MFFIFILVIFVFLGRFHKTFFTAETCDFFLLLILRLIMMVVPVSELTTGHNSVIKLLKAEMNFLIISVSDMLNLLREIEPLLELSK